MMTLILAGLTHLAVLLLTSRLFAVAGLELAIEPMTAIALGSLALQGAQAGGLFGGGGQTQSQEPLLTPEQRAAQRALAGFISTGKFGQFQAGEAQNLGYGDFGPTGLEQEGLAGLQGLLRSGIPDQFRLGDEALRDLLATSPEAIDRQFQPFKALAERELGQSEAAARRGAGFAGNLYSTDTIRKLGDVRARGQETLTAQLAGLQNQALDRRLQAIPLAYRSAEAQEGIGLGRVAASQQFGGLTRQLNTQAIQARDAELLRRRSELQLPIQAALGLSGQQTQFGVPSVTSSPYQELLGLAGKIGGQYLGSYAGAAGTKAGRGY